MRRKKPGAITDQPFGFIVEQVFNLLVRQVKNLLHDKTTVALLFTLLSFVFGHLPGEAAEYEQKQGNATLRIQASRVEGDQPEIRLADELSLTLELEGSASLEVQPLPRSTPSPDWEMGQSSNPEKSVLPGGRVRWRQTFRLKPVKAGELPLSLKPLRFREVGRIGNPSYGKEERGLDKWQEVAWKPISVRVTTEIANADLSELRDVAPPEELPPAPSWRLPIYETLAALVVLGLLLGGWRLFRRRHRPIALPPDRWALGQLERLQGIPLGTDREVEQFHTLLSDVIRRFLELRFQLPAQEQTTAEFLEEMRRSSQLTAEQQALLRDLMERWDLVKFARAHPSAEECQVTAIMARDFVEDCCAQTNESRSQGGNRMRDV